MDSEVRRILDKIGDSVSLRRLAKYFSTDTSLFYRKVNENIVNGVRYSLNENDIETLCTALTDISARLKDTAAELEMLRVKKTKERGFYPTFCNPFDHPLFLRWFGQIRKNSKILEPFYGDGDIPALLQQLDINNRWGCYDIVRPQRQTGHKVIKKDVFESFPVGYSVCITNPPFLERKAAKRKGLEYPDVRHSNLYILALENMLNNCQYIASIVPASFTAMETCKERLYGLILLDGKIFEHTDYPVALAMWNPEPQPDYIIYRGTDCLGTYRQLSKHLLRKDSCIKWKFNDSEGEIGVICYDRVRGGDTIRFVAGREIPPTSIKHTSRMKTRISGLPADIDLPRFIEKCNQLLARYRAQTHDIFLAPFKGLRTDGRYRRRIDFDTIRRIMNEALGNEKK